MKTLIIYDNEGAIVSQCVSPYKIPCGLPYIEVEIPSGNYIVSVIAETSEPVYEKLPQTQEDMIKNKIDILEQQDKESKHKISILEADNKKLNEVTKEQDQLLVDNAYALKLLEMNMGGI